MATGTTSNFVSTRNDIVAAALRKVKMWPEDGNPTSIIVMNAVKALNRLLRQEDLRGTGVAKNLWALSDVAIFLQAKAAIYGTADGLPNSVLDIYEARYRDNSGGETSLDIFSPEDYARLTPKDEIGFPTGIWLKPNRLLASQTLYTWPLINSINTSSEVTGTDALNYKCILGHTAAALNRPITGASWPVYWKQEGSSGVAWASSTAYTNGELIYITYKRPLYDFDTAYDNPDFPPGWDNYLIYKLAVDLAGESKLDSDDKQWLLAQLQIAEASLFPGSRPNSNTHHDRTSFF